MTACADQMQMAVAYDGMVGILEYVRDSRRLLESNLQI